MINTHLHGSRKGSTITRAEERRIEVTRAQSGRVNTHKRGARAATTLHHNLCRVTLPTKRAARA